MKEFKGTKGEWKTLEKNRIVYVENKDKVLIAEIDYCKTLGFEQATPSAAYFNAKLIASAPDLLKALQEVYDDLRQGAIPNDLKFIEEAINKALH